MGYRAKLQLALVSLGLSAIAFTGWEASAGATQALRQATYDRLTAIRQTHVRQVERWFQDLGNHTLALAADESTIAALESFARTWTTLPPAGPETLRRLHQQINAPAAWFPRDAQAIALQHHFIAANPYPVDRKDALLNGPGAYGQAHARYHPTLHRYQSAFGFYDVLLIDATSNRVVYSVFKEIDLGVPLEEKPYAESALAKIVQKALQLQQPEQFVLQDYDFYVPSHATPAAFLAAPVWRAREKIGVLAIQVSGQELNRLISSERLGKSGRIAIVGPENALRTGDAILQERLAGFPHDADETEVSTTSQGKQLLRSHARLRIPGLDWALMAEVDAGEAFAPVGELQRRILILGSLAGLAFFLAAAWLARSVTRPVIALASAADRLGQRDFSARLPVTRHDEIGHLAASFNRMADQLETTTVSKAELETLAGRLITAQEDERQRIARELHDDITQRMAAIAIEAGHADRQTDAPVLHETLQRVKQRMADLSRDIHRLSRRLHPKLLDDLGLVAAIEAEARALFERGGPVAEFSYGGDWTQTPAPHALALFRIVQESLRNAEKHAAASEITIHLERVGPDAHLTIQDDGRGFTERRSGLGLASMEERARSLGGHFHLESSPGSGTKVEVWLPIDEEAHRPAG